MSAVVTIVTGRISPDRDHEVADPYREALKDGPPPDLEETLLLQGDVGQLTILSVWPRREDLDAMLVSGEEPFARRLIRAAGGTPEATIYEVLVRSTRSGTG